jgi:hypothetical protein
LESQIAAFDKEAAASKTITPAVIGHDIATMALKLGNMAASELPLLSLNTSSAISQVAANQE